MTTQEAIEILRDTPIDIRSTREDDIHTLYATAQGMAIEALQRGLENVNADSCSENPNRSDDYVTIQRQFVQDAINIGLSGYISDDDKLTLEGMGIAVSEMPTTDLSGYSDRLWKSAYDCGYERCRQDAIDVAKQHWYKPDIAKALEELPSAQPDLLEDGTLMITVPNGMLNDVKRVLVDEVGTKFCKVMYQDEPERKKGEWKLNGMMYYCSECGHYNEQDSDNFCGHCGADMRGDENETD